MEYVLFLITLYIYMYICGLSLQDQILTLSNFIQCHTNRYIYIVVYVDKKMIGRCSKCSVVVFPYCLPVLVR